MFLLLFRRPSWTYACEKSMCVKRPVDIISDINGGLGEQGNKPERVQSLITCKMICGNKANLWPYPTGSVNLSDSTFNFLPVSYLYVTCK